MIFRISVSGFNNGTFTSYCTSSSLCETESDGTRSSSASDEIEDFTDDDTVL